MKKTIFASVLAAMALVSCSDTKYDVFDKSAADRLEDFKSEYKKTLTADGGLWAMEYFANEDEAGYTFIMRFHDDGSVDIYADHKYIGETFQVETSLWDMIADNGPVLTFNSYNTLFHVFSDPADIPEIGNTPGMQGGASGPDETGTGHAGDYEFQIMSVDEDGNTIRMLGKKRLYDIYLRKLHFTEVAEIEKYLADAAAVPSRFAKRFNDMTLTAEDGEVFRIYDLSTGIPSVYPLYGDKIDQTCSQNGIFTVDGIRFLKPFEIERADGTTFEVSELRFNEDGTLSGPGVADVRVDSPVENLLRVGLSWLVDAESFTGKAKDLYDAACAATTAYNSKYKFGKVNLAYKVYDNEKNALNVITRLGPSSGMKICYDYADLDYEIIGYGNIKPSSDFHCSVFEKSSNATKYEEEIPAYKAFKDYLCGNFVLTAMDPMCPNVIKFVDKNDSNSSFMITLEN